MGGFYGLTFGFEPVFLLPKRVQSLWFRNLIGKNCHSNFWPDMTRLNCSPYSRWDSGHFLLESLHNAYHHLSVPCGCLHFTHNLYFCFCDSFQSIGTEELSWQGKWVSWHVNCHFIVVLTQLFGHMSMWCCCWFFFVYSNPKASFSIQVNALDYQIFPWNWKNFE